jgi:hypothetical protein
MYGKVFASLYQGTLRGRAHAILVFTNMIACCDRDGIVDKHPRAISEEIGLSLAETTAAIAELEAPDPESRSRDRDGARIAKCFDSRTWGWIIVNHAKYRAIRDEDSRREANREAVRRYRGRMKACHQPSSDDIAGHACKPMQRQMTDTEAEAAAAAPPCPANEPPPPLDPAEEIERHNYQPAAAPRHRNWRDWQITVGIRCYVGRDEGDAWAAMFAAEGWDEMTRAYVHLSKTKNPKQKFFLSDFQSLREDPHAK